MARLERVGGTGPVLLVAPHGGRRPPGPAGRRTNDLHTAELTRELAGRTGAPAIINTSIDRNDIDLNRVSDVRRSARVLFTMIREEVDGMIARDGRATVLFLHGWNAIQPSCDLGVGASLAGGSLRPIREGVPSVSAGSVPMLLAFAARARERGIEVTVGERYPAAARENLVQALTGRYRDDPDPDVAALARHGLSGRLDAIQVELAVPLRWPGPWRERTLESLGVFFETRAPADATPLPGARASRPERNGSEDPDGPGPPRDSGMTRRSLELHDDVAGLGVFGAIERAADGRCSARLLVCLGRGGLALFTGEQAHGRELTCSGLEWRDLDDTEGTRLTFEGPVLRFPRSDPFLDLEDGLAGASLGELRANVTFEPGPTDDAPFRCGRARGTIVVDGTPHRIDADAARGPSLFPEAPEAWRERRRLHVPVGEHDVVSLATGRDAEDEAVIGERVRHGRPERLLSARTHVHPAADGRTPAAWRIEIVTRSGPLSIFGNVTCVVPVVRPAPGGPWLTWYGLARFGGGPLPGAGTFEVSRQLP